MCLCFKDRICSNEFSICVATTEQTVTKTLLMVMQIILPLTFENKLDRVKMENCLQNFTL